MSGETRAARSKALLDKKRRLEELKARRSHRQDSTSATTTTTNAAASLGSSGASGALSANQAGNLDEYINGLLNSAPPVLPSMTTGGEEVESGSASVVTEGSKSIATAAVGVTTTTTTEKEPMTNGVTTSTSTSTSPQGPTKTENEVVLRKVETFVMATQTDENDFPSNWQEEEEEEETNDAPLSTTEKDKEQESPEAPTSTKEEPMDEMTPTTTDDDNDPPLLSEEQIQQTLSSQPFTQFFTSASKRVERLLGSSHLSDLLVNDMTYYTNLSHKAQALSNSNRNGASGGKEQVVKAIPFQYPAWTAKRSITSIDWSPHHRGEVVLTSYNAPINNRFTSSMEGTDATSSGSTTTTTTTTKESTPATKSLTPQPPSSSLLSPSNQEEIKSDGLVLVWNLTMPHRPEAVFTCASPVTCAKFHPTEAHLIIGACHSGQVVVWDVREGRLPVQKSNVRLLDSTTQPTGHVHSIVGMEVVGDSSTGGGGSGGGGGAYDLVTVDSIGKVNIWTCSNLVDPKESWNLPRPNGYATALAVAPVSHSLVVGDECGKIFGMSAAGGTSSTTSRGSGAVSGGSNSKRRVQEWNASEDGTGGSESHFGNVTGLATKVMPKGLVDGDDRVPLSRGYVRGVHGLVLSCGIDWTTKLWAPAYTDKPILTLLSHSYDYMCDVQWNPVHPSIFASASSNGTVGLWNLASSLDEPITGSEGISLNSLGDSNSPDENTNGTTFDNENSAVNKIKWSMDGRRLAVTSGDSLHVLAMSEEIWKPSGDEEARLMNNLRSRGYLNEDE